MIRDRSMRYVRFPRLQKVLLTQHPTHEDLLEFHAPSYTHVKRGDKHRVRSMVNRDPSEVKESVIITLLRASRVERGSSSYYVGYSLRRVACSRWFRTTINNGFAVAIITGPILIVGVWTVRVFLMNGSSKHSGQSTREVSLSSKSTWPVSIEILKLNAGSPTFDASAAPSSLTTTSHE